MVPARRLSAIGPAQISRQSRQHLSHSCRCQCGVSWTSTFSQRAILASSDTRQLPVNQLQRRGYAMAHPKLGDRKRNVKYAYKSWIEQNSEHLDQVFNQKAWEIFSKEKLANKGKNMAPFMAEFLRQQSIKGHPRASLDAAPFQKMVEQHLGPLDATVERDLVMLCTYLVLSPVATEAKTVALGISVILSLAQLGNLDAMLFYGNAALYHESRDYGAYSPRPDHRTMMAKIKTMAEQDSSDFRLKVLSAKLALTVNDEETAIDLLHQTVESAQAAYTNPNPAVRAELELAECGGRFATLLTPWLDLAHLHSNRMLRCSQQGQVDRSRHELKLALDAARVGSGVDDPTAHYLVARLGRGTTADGQPIYTSSWLYHMTKAAASHHFDAAFQLGEFYLYTDWPYIEDQPSDLVKPTPFDTEPAERLRKGDSLVDRCLRSLYGLLAPHPALRDFLSESDRVFYSAALFPCTPAQRHQHGIQWLRVASGMAYAPANLALARAYLDKTCSPKAATPAAALKLQDARFSINQAPTVEEDGHDTTTAPASGLQNTELANRLYDENRAYHYMEYVFLGIFANESLKVKKRDNPGHKKSRMSDWDDSLSEESGHWVVKMLQYPDVRLNWVHKAKAIEQEARELCDQMNWTIRSPEGYLMYAPKTDMPYIST